MKDLSVNSLPLHKPVILEKSHTLKQAAQAMKNNQVGSILVSDGRGILKGIFTDRDLALALAIENIPTTSSLEKATRNRLVYVTDNATLKDVVSTMRQYAIRRVPVVHMRSNGRQRCLGIISLDDLVKERLIDSSEESAILKSQLVTPKERIGRGRMRSIFHAQGSKEHSFHTFIKNIEKNTGLNHTKSQTLAIDTLTLLLKRVPSKAGKNLLSQLPYELQMQLLPYISSADRSVSGDLLLSHVQKRFRTDEDGARDLLGGFWEGLRSSLSPGEIRSLSRELPRDLTGLFEQQAHH